jgi:hypothetical protein
MFERHPLNRPWSKARIYQKKKNLARMGWMRGCPLICYRKPGGKYVVLDGQSRLDTARLMEIEVWYTVDPECKKYKPADFNNSDAQSSWSLKNYVEVYAAEGNENYRDLLEYCATYKLPLAFSAKLLHKDRHPSAITDIIKMERLEVRDMAFPRRFGDMVMALRLYIPKSVTSQQSHYALYNLLRLPGKQFDENRLVNKARKFPRNATPCSTVSDYLTMFEKLYNYHATKAVNISFLATQAAKERSPIGKSKQQRNADDGG